VALGGDSTFPDLVDLASSSTGLTLTFLSCVGSEARGARRGEAASCLGQRGHHRLVSGAALQP